MPAVLTASAPAPETTPDMVLAAPLKLPPSVAVLEIVMAPLSANAPVPSLLIVPPPTKPNSQPRLLLAPVPV